MIANCYKDGKIINKIYDVISVKPDKKYGYFEFHQKIYHHEIITIKRFSDIDHVELIDKEGNRKDIKSC